MNASTLRDSNPSVCDMVKSKHLTTSKMRSGNEMLYMMDNA